MFFLILSIYLSTYLPTYLSIYLPMYLSIDQSIYLSVCLSVYLSSLYLSSYISVYLSFFFCLSCSISFFLILSFYLSIYLPIYLSVYLSIHLSICIYPSIYLSILFIYPSICLSFFLSTYLCTSSIFEDDNMKKEAIQRDVLNFRTWNHQKRMECRADPLVPLQFLIFPAHASKIVRLPRKSEARSYEVLHLSRKIILANLKICCSKMQPVSGNQCPDLSEHVRWTCLLYCACHAKCIVADPLQMSYACHRFFNCCKTHTFDSPLTKR